MQLLKEKVYTYRDKGSSQEMEIVKNINKSIRKLLHKTSFKVWPYQEKVDTLNPEE